MDMQPRAEHRVRLLASCDGALAVAATQILTVLSAEPETRSAPSEEIEIESTGSLWP